VQCGSSLGGSRSCLSRPTRTDSRPDSSRNNLCLLGLWLPYNLTSPIDTPRLGEHQNCMLYPMCTIFGSPGLYISAKVDYFRRIECGPSICRSLPHHLQQKLQQLAERDQFFFFQNRSILMGSVAPSMLARYLPCISVRSPSFSIILFTIDSH